MRENKPELKKCPFCGADAELKSLNKNNYKAVCSDLFCIANFIHLYHKTPEDAIEAWNTRAYEDRATERENQPGAAKIKKGGQVIDIT